MITMKFGGTSVQDAAAMANVAQVARDGANLMPAIITAVEARATVGEISNTLREVFGEYREAVLD